MKTMKKIAAVAMSITLSLGAVGLAGAEINNGAGCTKQQLDSGMYEEIDGECWMKIEGMADYLPDGDWADRDGDGIPDGQGFDLGRLRYPELFDFCYNEMGGRLQDSPVSPTMTECVWDDPLGDKILCQANGTYQYDCVYVYGGLIPLEIGWYTSFGGTGGWQQLNRYELNMLDIDKSELAFGDFDGDGRTDAFRATGHGWYVSPNSSGPWFQLSSSGASLSELAFGDFNGDGETDVFRTAGGKWYVASSGTGGWQQLNTSGIALANLAFGDFNGDGKTDVFRANGSAWYVSYSGTSAWTKLASSGITLPNLAFGDFNGDGRTDAFYANGIKWYVSHNASTAWQQLNTSDIPLSELAFGDFNADGKTDMFYAGFETDLPSVLPHPCDSNSGTLDPACHSDPFSGPGHMTLNTSTSAP